MRKLLMGWSVAALVAILPQSVAEPANYINTIAPVVQKTPYQVGVSSWYGEECSGNPTANGELFDMNGLTAAHRELPFGTRIRVTNLRNHRSLILRVNDRGPGIPGRILDVSMEAAKRLGFVQRGLVTVQIEILRYQSQPLSNQFAQENRGQLLD